MDDDPTSKPEDQLRDRAPRGCYNELLDEQGVVRPHQLALVEFLNRVGMADLGRIKRLIQKRVSEEEVTFNILGVPEGANRPWQLDVLPVVVDPDERVQLEGSLAQRARLLSAIHADIFGDQRLLRARVIPPELVFEHPGFHRACIGWSPLGGQRLHLYAADLGRDASGTYRVYSDRSAAPAGSGYALKNRLVLARTLSGLFNRAGVERVRPFFEVMARSIAELAPPGAEEPRIVLLSSGAQDESSFEHAYLARYLGFELVEGRDLTVRDRQVFLKSLAGLRKVDVILRRVYDDYVDPAVLLPDSLVGVPGLVEAAAAGKVGIANPIGSALVESPAMKAYLPAACQFLFGETLRLQSVETHWCGDAGAPSTILERPNDFVFKPAFGDRRGHPFLPAHMSSIERALLVDRVKARPKEWVAERWPGLSFTPVLGPDGIRYGPVSLRTFLCRRGDDYLMMPGGLARINTDPDGMFLSIGDGRTTKDVWVCADRVPSERPPASAKGQRVVLRRGGLELPSRLLDDVYWLGRLVERADMSARLLRAGFECLSSEASAESQSALGAILGAMHKLGILPKVLVPVVLSNQNTLMMALLHGLSVGLRGTCERIHQLTVGVRSRLSRDEWHVLKSLMLPFQKAEGTEYTPGLAIELCVEVLVKLAAVYGTTLENMVRGHAWSFLDMGLRVERAAMTLSVIRALLPPGATRVHMETLLEIGDSLLTYRARYLSSLQIAPVVDLVLTDDTNPRAFAFQVNLLMEHIARLPRPANVMPGRAERRLIELSSSLLTADVVQACAGDGEGLQRLLEELNVLIWQFSDDMAQTWFSHSIERNALAAPIWISEES